MITDKLDKWKIKSNMVGCEVDEDIFSIFYQEVNIGKGFMEMLSNLAFAIHELEVCVDGLIEDMEHIDGQKNKAA